MELGASLKFGTEFIPELALSIREGSQLWDLEFGAWCFLEFWSLEFGASLLGRDREKNVVQFKRSVFPDRNSNVKNWGKD